MTGRGEAGALDSGAGRRRAGGRLGARFTSLLHESVDFVTVSALFAPRPCWPLPSSDGKGGHARLGFPDSRLARCLQPRPGRGGGGPDDLSQRQADRPAAGAVLLLRQLGLRAPRWVHRATSSPGGPGSRRGARSPRTSSVYIQPSFEGGRNLLNVDHHLYLVRRAGGRRHAHGHLPHHGPERPPAARRLDRRALQPEGDKSAIYLRGGQEKRPVQPLRADLVEQSALDRARRRPGAARPRPRTTSSARRASSPTTWARACATSTSSTTCGCVTAQGRRLQRPG